MKKLLSILTFVVVFVMGAQAQTDAFKHMAVGASLGTDGIGVDVATNVTPNVELRAGASFLPALSFNTNVNVFVPTISADQQKALDMLDIKVPSINSKVDVKLKPKMATFKLLVDLYPSKNSPFRFTVGAYIGGAQVATAVNSDVSAQEIRNYNATLNSVQPKLDAFNKQYGTDYKFDAAPYRPKYVMGDYTLYPDEQGYAHAEVKVSAVRPYVGIGFGRAVPKNKSLGFSFDLGVQYWGTPKIYCNGEQMTKNGNGGDVDKLMDIAQSIPVYPVMSFRLCGKIL